MTSTKIFSALTLLLFVRLAVASPSGTEVSEQGLFQVLYQSDLQSVPLNQIHHWTLNLRDANGEAVSGARIEASGGMPVHNHGLPTQPRVAATDEAGIYRLEGLRFHMPGDWQLTLLIEVGGRSDIVNIKLRL